ncbi:hypothetical protein D5086_023956 [Populus alba]|uniref:Uncharacterized protein n=1 Tax=Populus alba TaxID=43335 RepID=A0ACC4B416_POPAL
MECGIVKAFQAQCWRSTILMFNMGDTVFLETKTTHPYNDSELTAGNAKDSSSLSFELDNLSFAKRCISRFPSSSLFILGFDPVICLPALELLIFPGDSEL